MCDLFNNFLKFHAQTQSPMKFAEINKLYGAINISKNYHVTAASCSENSDGSTKITIECVGRHSWRMYSNTFLRAPVRRVTEITTHAKLDSTWKLERVDRDDAQGFNFVFHDCHQRKRKCFMLTTEK